MRALLLAAENGEHVVRELAVSPVVFGLVSLGALVGLLLFTVAFRNIGNRH